MSLNILPTVFNDYVVLHPLNEGINQSPVMTCLGYLQVLNIVSSVMLYILIVADTSTIVSRIAV